MTTYKLSKWLANAGHVVGVFSFVREGHNQEDFVDLYLPIDGSGPENEQNLDALRRALERFRPDVVINQMPYEHDIGRTLRDFGPPLLLGCLRNTLFSVKNNLNRYASKALPKYIAPFFRNRLGRAWLLSYHRKRHRSDLEKILDTYDYFVMFAPQNLDELAYFVPGFEKRKIKLVPNSIPAVLDDVPAKEKRLLWLGRLDYHQKRTDLILPLWEKIRPLLPGWELDVVGDGPALDDLKREISSRSIKGVTLHGRQVPDEFYHRSPVYIMTSAFEGFPNTVIEAQSFGVIPVLFNSFRVAEFIVADGVDGFLVEPFDLDSMASRIVEIAQSVEQPDMASRALESARRFQIDTVGEVWQQLFDDCLVRSEKQNEQIHA